VKRQILRMRAAPRRVLHMECVPCSTWKSYRNDASGSRREQADGKG
jgi:hypothetical protein